MQQLASAKFLMGILMRGINHNSKVHLKYFAILFLTVKKTLLKNRILFTGAVTSLIQTMCLFLFSTLQH